jgi:uncharacterized metal-binding protein YceD (DUF177 family)
MTDRPAFERRIELDATSDGETHLVEPTGAERQAIADWLGLEALDALACQFTILRVQGGAIVRLDLTAAAQRICVASLEPMTEHIRETIEIHFDRHFADAAEDEIDDERLREPWPENGLDLAAMLIDHLALSLSPHPRKEGASSLVETFGGQTLSSPFDKLRELVDGKTKPAS